MAQLNVSNAKKRLDKFGILIIDEKYAKFLTILNGEINETDLVTYLKKWEDRMGYSKGGPFIGGTGEESNIADEYQKRFFKNVLRQVSAKLKAEEFDKLAIMCPEEDISLINRLLDKDLAKALLGIKEGNYVKANINDVLAKVLEIVGV